MEPSCRIELGKHFSAVSQLSLVVLMIGSLSGASGTANACGGCFRLPYRSLLEKIENSDRVVVAHSVDLSGSSWKIDQVIKGRKTSTDELLGLGVATSRILGPRILLWNKVGESWTVDGAADQELVAFLKGAVELSAPLNAMSVRQQAQRLRFFLPYLEHPDAQIADSAHAKLAKVPYGVLRELAAHLDHDRLVKWITAQRTAIKQRGALYLTLLGACGDERTAALLQEWMNQRWAGGDRGYLAALLTAHVEVHGEEAVRFIEVSYIQNRERTLGEIVAAVDALRTHGQAGSRVSRERIKASFHLLLRERPPLAELIIDDFARWQDWSIAAILMEFYDAGKQPWNNAKIINYLESCPLPAAKRFVQGHESVVVRKTEGASGKRSSKSPPASR